MQDQDVVAQCAFAIENSPLAMAVTEGEAQVVLYANPTWCRLVQTPIEAIVGTSLMSVLRYQRDLDIEAPIDQGLGTDQMGHADDREASTNRRDIRRTITSWPIVNEGRPIGLMVQVSDTIDPAVVQQRSDQLLSANQQLLLAGLGAQELADEAQRNLEAQRELARHKEDFVASVAHDLRTPLTTTKGFTQLLLRQLNRGDTVDAAKARPCLEQIELTIRRMESQIDDLLTEHQVQPYGGLDDDSVVTFSLSALVTRIVSEHRHTNDSCQFSLQDDGAEIYGSWKPHDVERVLTNLLSNAIKYRAEACEIGVSLRREVESGGPHAVLAVHDRGIGISPVDLPHIGERHYRAANVGERMGSGIGLAGVREIVARYGGTLSVDSSEEHGTTVSVRLPVS